MKVRSLRPRALLPPSCAVLGVCLALRSSPSRAADASAEELFREGRALLVAGRFAEACARLEQSQRLEPRLGTQLNVAFCQERLGKLATAWRGFREAADTAKLAHDAARERFAGERALALEPRVPWLTLRAASGAAPPAVLLDGSPLTPGEHALPLDPGEHTLSAEHDGAEYWRTTVTLREAERVTLIVPAPALTLAPTVHSSAAAAPRARFVYEVGAFVGFLYAATTSSTGADGPPTVRIEELGDGSTRRLSCATATCEYLPFDSGGLVVGASGFVGYALVPHTDVGLRFLVGPRVEGGYLLALGPSASFLLAERFRVGPSVLFGTARHYDDGLIVVQGPTGDELDGEGPLEAQLGFALGVGLELGVEVFRSPAGSLALQANPLFLYSSLGTALFLPVGAAYRWR